MLRAHTALGYALLGEANVDGAIAIAREGVRLSEDSGEVFRRGILFQLLAGASLARGDPDAAADEARQAVAFEHAIDDRVGLAHTVALLASIEMSRGAALRAATLLGGSEAIFRSVPASLMEPFQAADSAAISGARAALGDGGYLAATARVWR